MVVIANAKIPPSTFTPVMKNMVQSPKMKIETADAYVHIYYACLNMLIDLLGTV